MPYADGPRKRKPQAGLAPRKCVTCGEGFVPYRTTQRACSRVCGKNTPKARATAKTYSQRPEIRARAKVLRTLNTTPYPDRVRLYNLRGNLARYGVTVEWFEAKLAQQNGACAICGHVPPPGGIKAAARLHVDHDHVTGANRDLLCGRCNMGVGYFQDDPTFLRRAADYIDRHRNT